MNLVQNHIKIIFAAVCQFASKQISKICLKDILKYLHCKHIPQSAKPGEIFVIQQSFWLSVEIKTFYTCCYLNYYYLNIVLLGFFNTAFSNFWWYNNSSTYDGFIFCFLSCSFFFCWFWLTWIKTFYSSS